MPAQNPALTEATVSELPTSTVLITRTPLPALTETPISSVSSLNFMSSPDLLTQEKQSEFFGAINMLGHL